MSVEVELEKKIIECWGVVDDLDFIFKQHCDSDLSDDPDKLSNILLGLVSIYELRFRDLYDACKVSSTEPYNMHKELVDAEANAEAIIEQIQSELDETVLDYNSLHYSFSSLSDKCSLIERDNAVAYSELCQSKEQIDSLLTKVATLGDACRLTLEAKEEVNGMYERQTVDMQRLTEDYRKLQTVNAKMLLQLKACSAI